MHYFIILLFVLFWKWVSVLLLQRQVRHGRVFVFFSQKDVAMTENSCSGRITSVCLPRIWCILCLLYDMCPWVNLKPQIFNFNFLVIIKKKKNIKSRLLNNFLHSENCVYVNPNSFLVSLQVIIFINLYHPVTSFHPIFSEIRTCWHRIGLYSLYCW